MEVHPYKGHMKMQNQFRIHNFNWKGRNRNTFNGLWQVMWHQLENHPIRSKRASIEPVDERWLYDDECADAPIISGNDWLIITALILFANCCVIPKLRVYVTLDNAANEHSSIKHLQPGVRGRLCINIHPRNNEDLMVGCLRGGNHWKTISVKHERSYSTWYTTTMK